LQKGYKRKPYIKYSIFVMVHGVIDHLLSKEIPNYEKRMVRISEDDFFIPTWNEYYMLFKYNYTIPQLKNICKHYKLSRTGSKKKLITIIYNYLETSNKAIIIQKHVRGFLQRRENKMRGPAFLKREKCVNDCDFFTLDPVKQIHPHQFYSMKDQDGFIYGFDIISLWQLFEKSEIVENPYTRQKFPEKTRDILVRLIKVNNKTNIKLPDTIVNMTKQLELRIIDLFQQINTLGHYTDHLWFLSLDKRKLIRFCRELYDIWIHRSQINEETKLRIYPHGNPFPRYILSVTLNESHYFIQKMATKICENLVYHGITNDDKNLGAYYILSALTLQSNEAATALPWLYQSVM